jgi:hypothetical protein
MAESRLRLITPGLALAFAMTLLPPAGAHGRAQVIDRVLASVDGRLITLSDVRVTQALGLLPDAQTVDQQLEQWIDRLLVLQEVDRFAPAEPPADEIASATASTLASLGAPEAASARLAALGVNQEWVRQWVRDDLRILAYRAERFAAAAQPTGEELENYLRQNPSEFVRDGRPMPADEAQALARERVVAARRQVLMAEWLEGLRRRAAIVRPR